VPKCASPFQSLGWHIFVDEFATYTVV
jgi:hypothetical protein